MNTLLAVVVVLLISLGYGMGGYVAENRYLSRIKSVVAAWQDQLLALDAKAKMLECERLMGDVYKCQVEMDMLTHCIWSLQEELAREPRQII